MLLRVLVTVLCLVGVFQYFPENSNWSNVLLGLIGTIVYDVLDFFTSAIGKWAGRK